MISILISVKNGAVFLPACLDSIRVQSFSDWELLIVNDHSDDGTQEILSNYASLDPRINVYQNPGSGIIDALHFAYQQSGGKHITRMDADDLMTARKLELMSETLVTHGPGTLAVGLVEYFSETNLGEGYKKYADWLNELTLASANFEDLYKECSIPSACWMVHREDLDRAGHFRAKVYPEDYDLAFRFRKVGLKIKPIPEVLHLWRDHADRASRNDPHYLDNRFSELKVSHFIDFDYNAQQPLVLWGAGQRAKDLAKHLLKKKVNFRWITNNKKKIGKDIYGVLIESYDLLGELEQAQVIINISATDARPMIEQAVKAHSSFAFFHFC